MLRDLEREKARLKKSQRVATEKELERKSEAEKAEAKIDGAETIAARADAIEAAPHIDALDPRSAAIAWAQGKLNTEIDPASDRTLDPETETAATPETEQPPKFLMSRKAKLRAGPQRQRQRTRSGS